MAPKATAIEVVRLLALIASREDATCDFVGMLAGSMPVEAFFDPRNLERYLDPSRTQAGVL